MRKTNLKEFLGRNAQRVREVGRRIPDQLRRNIRGHAERPLVAVGILWRSVAGLHWERTIRTVRHQVFPTLPPSCAVKLRHACGYGSLQNEYLQTLVKHGS